jgi:hypothetical protein
MYNMKRFAMHVWNGMMQEWLEIFRFLTPTWWYNTLNLKERGDCLLS